MADKEQEEKQEQEKKQESDIAPWHFDQETQAVPAIAITDLNGMILASNQITNPYPERQRKYGKDKYNWAVEGARVMITRFWSASNAAIMLVPRVDLSALRFAPSVVVQEALHKSGFALETDICIWMGYLPYIRPVTQKDLEEGRLLRVFIGIIENIKATVSGTGGMTVMLSCRDRIKWLMDSSVFYTAQDYIAGQILNRSDVIFSIATFAIGAQYDPSSDPPTISAPSYRRTIKYDEATVHDLVGLQGQTLTASDWYVPHDPNVAPSLGGSNMPHKLQVDEDPYFRVITTRRVETSIHNVSSTNFLLSGQMPLEALKALSFQEVFPTEVFQDHRSGDLFYAPRGNDISGLTDPKRHYRCYSPANIFPDRLKGKTNINNKLVVFREEISSYGLKTNFIVSREAPNSQTVHDDYMLHLETRPSLLRNVRMAGKFHKVIDPTINSLTEAGLVAAAYARIWGKIVNVAMSVHIGDPSFAPGEIVQIAGATLFATHTYSGQELATIQAHLQQDYEKFLSYSASWDKKLVEYSTMAAAASTASGSSATSASMKNTGKDSTIYFAEPNPKESSAKLVPLPSTSSTSSTPQDPINNMLKPENTTKQVPDDNPDSTKAPGDTPSDIGFNVPPYSLFRVEAIIHKFNMGSTGFSTELALVSPF